MAGDSPAPPVQRKWTANEETGPGKWTMVSILTFLLVLATGLFVWSLWQRSRPRVFVASLHIADYNDAGGFADPAYSSWDLAGLNSLLDERGLDQWLVAGNDGAGQSLDDANEIEQAARATGTWLGKPNGIEPASQKLDTLVYYLRGNCVVHNGQAWLIAGEFTADSLRASAGNGPVGSLSAAIELGQLLDSIADSPAKNVIILADICDLVSVPQIGLLANTVPSMIQKVCEERPAKTDTNVWVISAAASLQHPYVSDLRRKTLLQSASEYALHPDRHESGSDPKTLSLDEFYDAVLRYSDKATEGNQTPLLFRYGHAGMIQADSGPIWKNDARKVVVAYKHGLEKTARDAAADPAEEKAATEETKKQTSNRSRSPAGGIASVFSGNRFGLTGNPAFASAWLPVPGRNTRFVPESPSIQEAAKPAEPAAGAQATGAPTAGGNGTPESPQAPAEITDPFLQFWQLRDELDSRNPGGKPDCFAPTDFAPGIWLNIQSLVVRNQRLHAIGTDPRAVAEVQEILAGLAELRNAIAGFSRIGNPGEGLSGELNRAWNGFQQQIANRRNGLSAWQDPSRLPTSYQSTWSDSRIRMRSYIDTFGRLPAWIEWCRSNPQEIAKVESLVREVSAFSIPAIRGESVLDMQRTDLRPMQLRMEELRTTVRQRFDSAQRKLSSGKRVTWQDEREFQRLLRSLVAQFVDRHLLQIKLANLNESNTEEPGKNDFPVDMGRTMAQILTGVQNDSGSASTRGDYRRWAVFVSETFDLLARTPVAPPADETPETLNHWANTLSLAAMLPPASSDTRPELANWQRECLAVVSVPASGLSHFMNSGAVIPASSDKKLYLETSKQTVAMQGSIGTIHEHPLPVKQGDGSLPERCFFRWELDSNPPANEDTIDRSLFISIGGQPVRRGQWTNAGTLPDEEIVLQIRADVDSARLSHVPVKLQIASDAQGSGASQPVSLSIIPPNPDRVDLIITRLNPDPQHSGELRPVVLTGMDGKPVSSGSGKPVEVVGPLSVPAIDGLASSRYDLQLSNRSAQAKQVRVRIWAADPASSSQRLPRGQTTVFRYSPITPNLVFQSQVVNLPGAPGSAGPADGGQVAGKPVRVPLEMPDSAIVPEGAPANFSELGAYGLVIVIEDGTLEPATPESNGVPTFKSSGVQWETWVTWKALNPYWDQLVKITPQAADGQLRLQIQVPDSKWAQYGIKQLPVSAFLTDASGKILSDNEVATLKPGEPPYTFRLGTGNRAGKVFAHLNIGGYPRAISFSSGLGQGEQAQESERPFAWLDCENAVLQTGDPAQTNVHLQKAPARSGLVVPRRIGINASAYGDQISLTSFQIPFRFDLPEPGISTNFSAKLDLQRSGSRTPATSVYIEDRANFPRWKAENGSLVFSTIATDHVFNVPEIASRSGDYDVRLEADAIGLQQNTSATLVFDQSDPVRSQISISESDKRLHEDGTLTVEFAPTDGESSIQQVYFAIAPSGPVDNYAEAEIRLDNVKATYNEEKRVWQQQLSGLSLRGQVPGRWRVLARSVDAAGNFQDQNTAAGFEWTGVPK